MSLSVAQRWKAPLALALGSGMALSAFVVLKGDMPFDTLWALAVPLMRWQVLPLAFSPKPVFQIIDLLSALFLVTLFFRSLDRRMSLGTRMTLTALGMAQAGVIGAALHGSGLGVLLLLLFLLGWGLDHLGASDQDKGYLAIALATAGFVSLGVIGLALSLASFPVALLVSGKGSTRSLLSRALLAGFAPLTVLSVFFLINWMMSGSALAEVPRPWFPAPALMPNVTSPFAFVFSGNFVMSLVAVGLALILLAPGQFSVQAQSARALSAVILLAMSLLSCFGMLSSSVPILASASAVALCAARKGSPDRSVPWLFGALIASWLFAHPASAAHDPFAASAVEKAESVGTLRAWGVREEFSQQHPGKLPRLIYTGEGFIYVLGP